MIREATYADLELIGELGAAFHAACPYADIPLDPEAFEDFAGKLIDGGVILLSDEGMLGGLLHPMFFNPSAIFGAELFWWAPKEGRALREAFEDWAKSHGAMGVLFAGLANERSNTVTKLFERAGYAPTELAFAKRFHA